MRVLMKVLADVEVSNRAIQEGKLPGLFDDFVKAAKPEGLWFAAMEGKRGMIAVFDMTSPSDQVRLGEPFFMTLGATVEIIPLMDMADLQKGLSA